MITNPQVFEEDHLPRTIGHREAEVRQVTRAFEPSGASWTGYADAVAFSIRAPWNREFVVAGDVTGIDVPEGVTVIVDGEHWEGG